MKTLLVFSLVVYSQISVVLNQNQNSIIYQREWQKPAPRAKLETDLEWIQGSLEKHNYYRKLHGVPPLILNHTLCEISQAWANKRANGYTKHNPERGFLGENIYTIGIKGKQLELNSSAPVDAWYREIEDYDFTTCATSNGKIIGHFTALVWEQSREVGIASTFYQTAEYDHLVVVANYYPAGNIPGRYSGNVFPRMTETETEMTKPETTIIKIVVLNTTDNTETSSSSRIYLSVFAGISTLKLVWYWWTGQLC